MKDESQNFQSLTESQSSSTGPTFDSRLVRVTNSIPAFVGYLDLEHRYQFVNDSYLQTFGKSREDLIGLHISHVVGEEAYQRLKPLLQKAMNGEKVPVEIDFQIPSGEKRYFQGQYTPDFGSDGTVRGIVILQNDITEKKQYLQQLKESEARTRTLLDHLPQLLWATNPQGRPIFINQKYLDYTGIDVVQDPESWTKIIHPQDLEPALLKWEHSLKSGDPFEVEYRLRRYDGDYRWYLGRALPIRNESGQIQEWLGSCTDIHDRKQMEDRQQRTQRKVTQLQMIAASLAVAQTQDEIARVVVDEGLKAIQANGGSIVLNDEDENSIRVFYASGISDDLVEKYRNIRMDERLPITDCIRRREPVLIRKYKEIEERYPELAETLRSKGRKSFAAFPLLVQGRALGALGLSFDSEQEFLPERLSYITILAEQCAQSIERARLFEAEKKAREAAEIANRAKSQFLANMSHEIRTPLNAILGFSDLLSEGSISNDDRLDYRKRIQSNGHQLLHLIDDILNLSKVEAGKLEIEKAKISVSDLIAELHDSLASVVQQKGVATRLSVDSDVPPVIESDPTRLKQILTNLLGNSVKFTNQGTIHTRISVAKSNKEGHSKLQIDVEDTGIGIAPELHSQLFQPFVQADSSVTRRFGGTGLGLVLSRRIAEALGGDLELVRSEPQRGSLFRLRLPLKEEPVSKLSSPANSTATTQSAPKPPLPLNGVRILLAEDFFDNEALIRAYLKPTGALLEVARNGQEACEKALSRQFDVVLMDIQMPVMDGLEATRKLREQNFQCPIIALSAHALSEEVQRSLEAGCQAHLTKPVSRKGLVEEIRKVLRLQ